MFAVLTIAAAIGTTPVVHEVQFAPLTKREHSYARLGPAGPFYPDKAARAGKTGEVLMDCRAGEGGLLDDCHAISETPDRYSFGAAAERMAEVRRIGLAEPVEPGTPVRVRVPFEPAP